MTARATQSRGVVGFDATTGQFVCHEAGSEALLWVHDDGESVCGWEDGTTFWPAVLSTLSELNTARFVAAHFNLRLGGSPLTSRAVFRALNPKH